MVASHGKPRLSVCLLDDDLSVLKATTRLLRSAGWEVEPFSDPVVFLRYVQTYCPPVVVIDIRMPMVSGLEVQKRLHNVSPTTRVIVLTGSNDPSIRSQVMAVGASAFLLKPADDVEFLAEIESAAAIAIGDG
jgi:FixJ family two-component response regulator